MGAVWNGRTIRQHTRPESGEPIQTSMAANDSSNRPRVDVSPAVQRTQTRRRRVLPCNAPKLAAGEIGWHPEVNPKDPGANHK